MRRGKQILAVVPRTPDSAGPSIDRFSFRFLSQLGKLAHADCLPEAPPASAELLRASLNKSGVGLLQTFAQEADALHARVRKALRARDYCGIVLIGETPAARWLLRLRLMAPGRPVVCVLPDAAALLSGGPKFSSLVRDGYTAKWRNILQTADGVWVPAESEREEIMRAFGVSGDRVRCSGGAEKSAAAVVDVFKQGRRERLRASSKISILTRSASGARRAEASVLSAFKRKPQSLIADGSRVSVSELNRLLGRASGDYVWWAPEESSGAGPMLRALRDGMELLPFAGAAVPYAVRPAKSLNGSSGLFSTAWAMRNKGNWHEVDYLSRADNIFLRRSVISRVGLLDERFRFPETAWVDFALRLQQAGFPVFLAKEALFSASILPRTAQAQADRELIVEKWCKGGLKFMESLLTGLEPPGYRIDASRSEASVG
jgi:hypothetical protein